jgi:hypothetical protein
MRTTALHLARFALSLPLYVVVNKGLHAFGVTSLWAQLGLGVLIVLVYDLSEVLRSELQ